MTNMATKLSLLQNRLWRKIDRMDRGKTSRLMRLKKGLGVFWTFLALFIIYIALLLVFRAGR